MSFEIDVKDMSDQDLLAEFEKLIEIQYRPIKGQIIFMIKIRNEIKARMKQGSEEISHE